MQLPHPPPLPQRLEALRFVSRGLPAAFVDGVAACTDWRAWDAASDQLRAVSFTFVDAGAYAAGRLEWRVQA